MTSAWADADLVLRPGDRRDPHRAVEGRQVEGHRRLAVRVELDDAGKERERRLGRQIAFEIAAVVAAGPDRAGHALHAVDQHALEVADLDRQLALAEEIRRPGPASCKPVRLRMPTSTAATVTCASSPGASPATVIGSCQRLARLARSAGASSATSSLRASRRWRTRRARWRGRACACAGRRAADGPAPPHRRPRPNRRRP